MPSGLFKRETQHDRWVFAGPTPDSFKTYDKDHVDLLVRYMFQISPDEQKRLGTGGGGAAAPAAAAPAKAAMAASQKRISRSVGPVGAGRAP